ncbi:MAG: pyruvate kinase [Spirochaetales bacterium]|nr:pyruvate kinase [Spirochaetales bacterium]
MKKKQTKIVATISDMRCDTDFIKTLYLEGMNVARLNTAHQSLEDTLRVVKNIREVSSEIAILLDTKGPEVRTAGITEPLSVQQGDEIFIGEIPPGKQGFAATYSHFVKDVPVDARILIDDGLVSLLVINKSPHTLVCQVENSGQIGKKKSVNVPGVHLGLPALSDKDREYINFAIEHDIDFIAHSFVRSKEDLKEIQDILDAAGSRVKIIAKIENREGVQNLKQILKYSAGVMVARGDLGIEIPAEEVPAVQKHIIRACIKKAKPVITATQMLHSMIENPRPTRAEVSDVANAVYDGTDAIMLSGETAYGKYPVESVRTMAKIVRKVETQKAQLTDLPVFKSRNHVRNYLAKCAVSAAIELPVTSMIIDSDTGHSARVVSAYRGHIPIFAKAQDSRVVRELALSYGVYPSQMDMPETTDAMVRKSLESLLEHGEIHRDDLVVILAGTPGNTEGSNFIEVNTVAKTLGR